MKRFLPFATLFLLLALPALAQVVPPQPAAPAQPSVWNTLKDPDNITFLTFLGANLADAKTDWHMSIAGKEYTFTPAQRLSVSLGGAAAALYLREQFPSWRRPISVVMGVATAYFAGRALANTYNHGMAPVGGSVALTTAGYRTAR